MARNSNNTSGKPDKKPNEIDLATFLDIASWHGNEKRRQCSYLNGGVCRFRSWDTRRDIPLGAGIVTRIRGQKPCWFIEPTSLFCAFCPCSPKLQEIEKDLDEIDDRLDDLTSKK